MAKVLSWGKCTIEATPIENTGAPVNQKVTFPTPADGTTQLTTTQGDKTELKIEGGAVEAARYGANSYELSFQIRLHSTLATPPLNGTDGVVLGEYTVVIKPENSAAPQVTINRASCNVQISYTAAEGVVAAYTFSSLDNGETGQITVAVAGS